MKIVLFIILSIATSFRKIHFFEVVNIYGGEPILVKLLGFTLDHLVILFLFGECITL